ncbi:MULTISPECIES: hypothetical protein [unclassified Mesorhizobium]|uniref:hypothetical protein n=1 Tax=unclassified Mesorhizobium TaxID=325217 RepID=UPI00112E4E68|nr:MULTISPECIES: hypothetical protein [unclassified Mesorhizobium]TPJ70502.1 hypothetical protein FJ462_07355 [Mesorhizobium sp. B2-6-7]TPJ76841.1 hypothetical protein FJ422_29465 [Mesorhizobium sp. B2-6-3]
MANRALALKQKQVTALCKGAAAAGYAPIVQIGKVWVRLVPEKHAIPPQDGGRIDPATPEDDLDAELAAFEAKHGHG